MDLSPLIDALLMTPYAKKQDSEHIYVRCPICGDSHKHQDGAHCGVWIRPEQPLIYHCWICDESGIVDHTFLSSLDIDDTNLLNDVNKYNLTMSRHSKNIKRFDFSNSKELLVPTIQDNQISRNKLEYMCTRLGLNFTYKSLEFLRVIFSLKDFLTLNKLQINPKYAKAAYFLERDYVGFLSSSRDTIIFRNITKDPKIRYIKYSIYPNNPAPSQMYILPAKVDVMSDDINLRIAEGTFDILGIFFHVMNAKTDSNIYAAVAGSGYAKIIQDFLQKGFMTNLNIWIYSDQDKSINFYKKVYDKYAPWCKSFHIMYNTKSKDTGVPKDLINEVESDLRWF